MLNLTAEQIQLASLIDAHVSRYPASTTPVQMDYLCQQYPGFYRLALLLESLAQGIAEGEIEVPKDY